MRSRAALAGLTMLQFAAFRVVLAHNPAVSWAVATVESERIVIEAELAGETAMALLGVEPGTAGIPPDASVLFVPLNEALLAGKLYRLSRDGKELPAVKSQVEFDGSDAFRLRVEFPRPREGQVDFRAEYLVLLSSEHRTSITVAIEDGPVLVDGQPERGNPVVSVALPPRSN